jgi:hypothetical protein
MKCILIIGKKTKTKRKSNKIIKKEKKSSISNVADLQRYQWRFHW